MKLPLILLLTFPTLAAVNDEEVRKLLDNRVNASKRAVGIVVGVLDEKGQRIISDGRRSVSDPRPPGGDTIFEIGSITKAFTGILLADMVLKGEVQLADPVSKYLPESVKVPAYKDQPITLLSLTTQTSGLPRMPNNFHPADPSNPYADYTVERMYDFISGYSLTRPPGEKYDYSNLGVGLLGHILARRSGKSYEELVTERILKPLGMTRTSITLNAAQKADMALGHTDKLRSTGNWDLPTFAGAGALRSTANDMLRFLAANLGPPDTPLRKAIALSHEIRTATGTPDLSIAMGWHVFEKFGSTVVWHNGGTGGYRTWAGFNEAKRSAVVVLCNTSFGVDDLGLHALVSDFPAGMLEAPVERKEISVSPEILQTYVGRYQMTPAFSLNITFGEGNLSLQATGQPKVRLYAESQSRFFIKEVEAAVTFEKSASSEVTGLILHQGGANQKAQRMAVESK